MEQPVLCALLCAPESRSGSRRPSEASCGVASLRRVYFRVPRLPSAGAGGRFQAEASAELSRLPRVGGGRVREQLASGRPPSMER